ncbi:fasciclin domain-containing protein [Streptomyces sp. NPDC058595]|uniref:fasciclin domain-containing protein n=1 Tax=Streptomyces sp. NPDC058595 TaxID=3346550 RepID=UPI00365B1FDA
MKITRLSRAVVSGTAAVVLPITLGVMAPSAFAETTAGGGTSTGPFGPACASVPETGPGSLASMAKEPVATAASNNPDLSTLTAAVKKAGLVDTLNNSKNITVFAPSNEAFAKIPKADLDKLLADKAQLTKVLTYHVVGQKITQSQLANGSFKTLEGASLTTAGSGQNFTVNNTSKIVCGGVPTANATVNIIDTVLTPPN